MKRITLSLLFLATLLGTSAAIGIHYMKKRHPAIMLGATNIPLLNADIVTGIKVEFTRKNKTFIKDLYIIMTSDMIQNIKEPENIQYFSDTTYYCIPPQC